MIAAGNLAAGLIAAAIAVLVARNQAGPSERRVSADGSRTEVWTVPTNEELLVVARQAHDLLLARK